MQTMTPGQGPYGGPVGPIGVPTGAPTNGAGPLFPGVTIIDAKANTAPIIVVIGREKSGKSATSITSLVGWPAPGFDPLVLAWDKTGPDSCIKLGYQPHAIRIADQPGARFWDKGRAVLDSLELNAPALHARYGAIVTDCMSTMVDRTHEDARRFSKNSDPRSHFGDALMQSKEWINRIVDLGLPTIWLTWLREPEVNESKGPAGQTIRKFVSGGVNVLGGTRALLAGKAHHILYLEKVKHGVGAQGADENGDVRLFHTKPYENIDCSGRYSHILPEPAPPHLGWILSQITGKGPYAPGAGAK